MVIHLLFLFGQQSSLFEPLRVMIIEDMIYLIHIRELAEHALASLCLKRELLFVDIDKDPPKPVAYLFTKDHVADAISNLSSKPLHLYMILKCGFQEGQFSRTNEKHGAGLKSQQINGQLGRTLEDHTQLRLLDSPISNVSEIVTRDISSFPQSVPPLHHRAPVEAQLVALEGCLKSTSLMSDVGRIDVVEDGDDLLPELYHLGQLH
ncbi:hypothetical protein EJ110_NYTH17134 [Nymphaea thermarum]|nr:hypothetical protein EJ110_NYTH17134 [Nymphaea thermarum]